MAGKKKEYDLEKRTLEFAKDILRLCKKLPESYINRELTSQLVRSSGSVGANYREANEALGKKDFSYRMRIARKECKESSYWLALVEEANPALSNGHLYKPIVMSLRGASSDEAISINQVFMGDCRAPSGLAMTA
ncbi:MAG: four helix bundle protein [Deltaproteobacteria bacterium CG11_big_fil_rev_8_21_14_0_20_49_13]|nr:MAG: four helix bundle protein [Deltaproteobacteria bacterium CG11_big_fil_rev_8_21_14_0_20_49_13]